MDFDGAYIRGALLSVHKTFRCLLVQNSFVKYNESSGRISSIIQAILYFEFVNLESLTSFVSFFWSSFLRNVGSIRQRCAVSGFRCASSKRPTVFTSQLEPATLYF